MVRFDFKDNKPASLGRVLFEWSPGYCKENGVCFWSSKAAPEVTYEFTGIKDPYKEAYLVYTFDFSKEKGFCIDIYEMDAANGNIELVLPKLGGEQPGGGYDKSPTVIAWIP